MHLIGILVRIHPAGAHQQMAVAAGHHVFHVEGAVGKFADQRAVRIVQIEVGPTGAFTPPDQLPAAFDQFRAAPFHIGIGPLRNDRPGAVGPHGHIAQVQALEVAAQALQPEAVFIPQPFRAHIIQGGILRGPRAPFQVDILVFEGIHPHFVHLPGREIHYEKLPLGAGLAGHLVFIGL